MVVRRIVGGITGLTASGVRSGVSTAERIIGHGRDTAAGAATAGTTVASGVIRSAVGRLRPVTRDPVVDPSAEDVPSETTVPEQGPATAEPAPEARDKTAARTAAGKKTAAKKTAATKTAATKTAAKKTTATKTPAKKAPVNDTSDTTTGAGDEAEGSPRTVTAADLPLPELPEEPPVDVVEQAIAAEEAGETLREGFATEPKGASRDETHGDAALQRAEVEELAEETAEASPEGSLDIETPVGTTGADVGFNPDTAEADLQQPATEPLVDPSLTKEVIADAEIGAGDADVRKG